MESRGEVIEELCGFRANHKMAHHLIKLTTMEGNMKKITSKAFDIVWQDGLIYKLHKQQVLLE